MASPKVGRTIFLLSQCTHTSSVCCMVLLGTSPMSCLLNFRGSLFFFQAWPLDLPTGLRSGILIPTPPWMSWHPIAYYIQGISTSSKVKEVPRYQEIDYSCSEKTVHAATCVKVFINFQAASIGARISAFYELTSFEDLEARKDRSPRSRIRSKFFHLCEVLS